jgi:hypothetical protein
MISVNWHGTLDIYDIYQLMIFGNVFKDIMSCALLIEINVVTLDNKGL